MVKQARGCWLEINKLKQSMVVAIVVRVRPRKPFAFDGSK
jgi:hypothetical protein